MKKLLTIILLFSSLVMYSQSTHIESLVKQDSVMYHKYKCVTEGCIKVQPRYVIDNQDCPVFLDENGFLFYICIIKQHLEYITLDTNVSID